MSHVSEAVRAKVEEIRQKIVNTNAQEYFGAENAVEYELFKQRENEHREYIQAYKGKYQTMMNELREIPLFCKIVNLNIHCRSTLICYAGSSKAGCLGETCFHDNQVERAKSLAQQILDGKIEFDILCIQELQENTARNEFLNMLAPKEYKASYTQAVKDATVTTAKGIAKGVKVLGSILGLVESGKNEENSPSQESPFGVIYDVGTATIDAWGATGKITRAYINSGLVIVYKKEKFALEGEPEIFHFPVEFSSGADRKAAAIYSYKGAIFARFRILPKYRINSNTLFICNTHPSPYVSLDDDKSMSYYAKTDLQIKQTHMYQLTLLAIKIRDMTQKYSEAHDNKKEYIFVAGDMNINKYLQSGSMGEKGNEMIETLNANNRVVPQNTKTIFAKGIGENERCFREDVPYVSLDCDQSCCGSEYLTMLEILSLASPVHLVSLPEYEDEVVAPLQGRYSWDSLFNSVIFSPHWANLAFELIDHIHYCKFGRIPAYAHVMTKRFICDPPVVVNEGPLYSGCAGKLSEKIKLNVEKKQRTYGEVINGKTEYKYYDIGDHYALECNVVLDDDNAVLQTILKATTTMLDPKNKSYKANYISSGKKHFAWGKLIGFDILPDAYYENAEQIQSREVFFPRQWFQSFQAAGLPQYPRKSKIVYSVQKSKKEIKQYPNGLLQKYEQFVSIPTQQNKLKDFNNQNFSWTNYLPTTREGFVAFNQFCIKLLNRMLEREKLNRQWKQKSGESSIKDVYAVIKDNCSIAKLYECVIFKQFKTNNTTKKNRKNRQNYLRYLNRGNVNTLKNAKVKKFSFAKAKDIHFYERSNFRRLDPISTTRLEEGLYKGSIGKLATTI